MTISFKPTDPEWQLLWPLAAAQLAPNYTEDHLAVAVAKAAAIVAKMSREGIGYEDSTLRVTLATQSVEVSTHGS